MNPVELPLRRILEISTAVTLIADNKYLDGTTAYRVGRLGDFCKSASRSFMKTQQSITKKAREEEKTLKESVKNGTDEEKKTLHSKILEIVEAANNEIERIQEEQIETIKIPVLKVSDFIAKKDITELVMVEGRAESKIAVKEGQTLVPVRFFTLMGDLITDDKNAMASE